MARDIPPNTNPYGIDWGKASNAILKWGDNVQYRNGAMGLPPSQQVKDLLIDIPNIFNTPVLFTIDLEIIFTNTGLPPVAPFPVGGLNGGCFWVQFGAGNDVRRHKMQPGIHSVIGDSLRVQIFPHFTGVAALNYEYRAHCTVQEGVSPSYTWGP